MIDKRKELNYLKIGDMVKVDIPCGTVGVTQDIGIIASEKYCKGYQILLERSNQIIFRQINQIYNKI